MNGREARRMGNETVHYFGRQSTILVLLPPGELRELVQKTAEANKTQIWTVEHAPDLIAIPYYLAIVDPQLFPPKTWADVCDWYNECDDPKMKVLFVGKGKIPPDFPKQNMIRPPKEITKTTLNLLMVHLRSTVARRRRIFEKKERQIVRLMYVLCKLDQGGVVSVSEVAKEFRVAPRTIQRDLDVLLMAGYPIDRAEEPGLYRFPRGFRSHVLYTA
jgi:hypothetical protein